MSISSMTGFARENGDCLLNNSDFNWFWEIKSVNNKSMDVKFKLPSWLEFSLLPGCKEIVQKYFARGSFSVFLDLSSNVSAQKIVIDDKLLSVLTLKAIELYETYPNQLQKPSTTDLLNIKNVFSFEDETLSEEDTALLVKHLLSVFENACKKLKKDREEEGKKIKKALLDILVNIDNIVKKVETIAQSQPEKIKQKLLAQLEVLLDPSNAVSEDRLSQEVAMYVAKADIQEEVDRLKAHILTAQDLLNKDEAVGRRLDFLCQELNREANTTCSKSCDIELTNLGMQLKTLIEQFREQVQNIE